MEKFVMNDNNCAIAYYRYSSAGQKEASIEQQREAAHKYAEAHGLTIIKEYADKAISGRRDDRPNYNLMLKEIGKLKPSRLILWKTDRLGRDRYTLAIAKVHIRKNGCRIECVTETIPQDTAESVLVESVIEGLAEFYSRNLSDNVKRGQKYQAEHCLYVREMLGYKKGEDGKYAIDEDKAPIVRRIFGEYVNGKPITEIIEELTKQGVRSIKGAKLTVNSVRAILRNRKYIGEYSYAGIVTPNGMPAIVSEELFEQAQAKLQANKHKRKPKVNAEDDTRYWLTGKIYCGLCGASMFGMCGTSKTKHIHHYYSCKNYRKKKICNKKSVCKNDIEQAVLDELRKILSDEDKITLLAKEASAYYESMYADKSYLKSLMAERKSAQKSLENIIKAIEKGIYSDTVQQRLTELESKVHYLDDAITEEEEKTNMLQDEYSIGHFMNEFRKADFTNEFVRDKVFERFVEKVIVYDDKVVVACNYCDDQCKAS